MFMLTMSDMCCEEKIHPGEAFLAQKKQKSIQLYKFDYIDKINKCFVLIHDFIHP